jgi:hypothetical protein
LKRKKPCDEGYLLRIYMATIAISSWYIATTRPGYTCDK